MKGDIAQSSAVQHRIASERFAETRFKLYGLKISAQFNENAKDVIFDNLVTNIVKKRDLDAE